MEAGLGQLRAEMAQKQQPYNTKKTEAASSLRCTVGDQETMFLTQTAEMQTGHDENL